MLDRESTFADPFIVKVLKTQFIPVAIDQAYQRRQKDTEGEFYRKIAGQSRRNDFNDTTQGLYMATADGTLLGYSNNRGAQRIRRFIEKALEDFRPIATSAIKTETTDKRFNPQPPEGGLVIRVQARVLGGYELTDDRWRRIFQSALSRDNLWVSQDEHTALVQGMVLKSLQRRIARYHLVDNTRGEPPMWSAREVRSVDMRLGGEEFSGKASLTTASGDRSFDCEFYGRVETTAGRVTRFDVVAKGLFQGEGRSTPGAPRGKFPLAISFTLADGTDVADAIPPQGSRGWVRGYIE